MYTDLSLDIRLQGAVILVTQIPLFPCLPQESNNKSVILLVQDPAQAAAKRMPKSSAIRSALETGNEVR